MTEIIDEKWVFIINPAAGNGSAKDIVPKLEQMISRYKISAELVYTEGSGHATEISEAYIKKGFKYFIAIGGDGTMNEMAQPLIERKGVIAGIIPSGTGNDFAQILGYPNRFEEGDWELFFKKNTASMDIGVVNNKIFLNGMGLGFDAQVAAENYTVDGKVKEGSANKYIWHIVKTLLFFREKNMIYISGNEKQQTDCFINTIANGRRFAGGFLLTPEAIANDGLLDVCMIKKLSLFERFRLLLKVPKGTHIKEKKVDYYQTPHLNLEFSEVVPFHVDGELCFANTFDVLVKKRALNVIFNPDGNHFFKS